MIWYRDDEITIRDLDIADARVFTEEELRQGWLKCTRDFGQLEFLTAPIVRTTRFQESPCFGHLVFENPRKSDRRAQKVLQEGNPLFIGQKVS